MSNNFASPNYESLATGPATGAREMGHGGGSLHSGERGPGLRAGKLRTSSEALMHKAAFKREPQLRERLAVYSDIVNGVASDRMTAEEAGAHIADLWNKQTQEAGTESGDAFNPHAVIEWVRRGLHSGELNRMEAEQLLSELRTRIIAEYIQRWKETEGKKPGEESMKKMAETLDDLLEYFCQPVQPPTSWEATAARLSQADR